MELSTARYRLLFKHPFGTAHGLRDGTDSVFVRLEENGVVGFGEATLPPYLAETQQSVLDELRDIDLAEYLDSLGLNETRSAQVLSAPTRAALSTAYYDLTSRKKGIPISILAGGLTQVPSSRGRVMMTLGHSRLDEIPSKIRELPGSDVLKVKLGSRNDAEILNAVLQADTRPLFLDANQGWIRIEQALEAIELVGNRLVGLEQPFAKDRFDLHRELSKADVEHLFADESIQDAGDMERVAQSFTGINIKLMKCGGLDRAIELIERARSLGLGVMLGSMSESSLGCGAMAQLCGYADLIDLDGPWLIANDPFVGLKLEGGRMALEGSTGVGVVPSSTTLFDWDVIDA